VCVCAVAVCRTVDIPSFTRWSGSKTFTSSRSVAAVAGIHKFKMCGIYNVFAKCFTSIHQ
jgi:hypothetical protein